MIKTSKQTALVSSTDLKRKYKKVKQLLDNNMIVIVTNRNNTAEGADGIFIPYSELVIEKLEDLIEDIEMEKNKDKLVKEFEESYNSGNGKRVDLKDL